MYQLLNKLARKVKYPQRPTLVGKLISQIYYEPGVSRIRDKDVDYVVVGGNKFYPSEQLWCVTQPVGPWFEGTRETDIALDIGADIGGVTIPLAKKCKKVYAVEPIYFKELERNVELNRLGNIEIWPHALGKKDQQSIIIEYGPYRTQVWSYTLKSLLDLCGGKIDFLKIDVEGAEWDIPLYQEILDIRELRIEFHRRRGHKEDMANLEEWNDWLECNRYEVKLDRDLHKEISILFTGVDYMRASKLE